MSPTSPVFCAIDRPDLDGAERLARALTGTVGGLKLGLEFVTANGPAGVRRLAALGLPVFLDVKLHDIPNTVAGAIRATDGLGIDFLTLHAAGGRAMLQAAVAAANDLAHRPRLLGVTVLTSLDDDDLGAIGVAGGSTEQVLRLADLAAEAGLDGLICAPPEIAPLRAHFDRRLTLVVPGIRPAGVASHDQKRAMTPAAAIAAGADHLVVGRAITGAPDPGVAARAIAAEIDAARAA